MASSSQLTLSHFWGRINVGANEHPKDDDHDDQADRSRQPLRAPCPTPAVDSVVDPSWQFNREFDIVTDERDFKLTQIWPNLRDYPLREVEDEWRCGNRQSRGNADEVLYCSQSRQATGAAPANGSLERTGVYSRRSIMPHDIGRQWSAVRENEIARAGSRRADLDGSFVASQTSSGSMLTRNRAGESSAGGVVSDNQDQQLSAATTVCTAASRLAAGQSGSSDSEDFSTPVPVRRRNTVCGSSFSRVDGNIGRRIVTAERWSTPLPSNIENIRPIGIENVSNTNLLEGFKVSTKIEEVVKPSLSEITPTASGVPQTVKSLASDEPVNRKRGWSILDSEENGSQSSEYPQANSIGALEQSTRTSKRIKITDAA